MKNKARIIIAVICVIAMAVPLIKCSADMTAPPATTAATTAATTLATTTAATTTAARTSIRIAALKGPTGIGLVKLMAEQEAGESGNDYQFSLHGDPNEVAAQLSNGQVDIAALPTNLAAVLYQKTSQKIRLLAINTLGVLYILEKGESIKSLADLAGREILATGQAAVPEYVLSELLAKGKLAEPATVTYKTEHSELAALAASGAADLVMLPEPFVTTVLSKNPDFRIALDLTDEWQKIQSASGNNSELSMGCLVVTESFARENPAAIQRFLAEYRVSVDFVNASPQAAGSEVARFQIMADAGLAAKAIPNCHIVLIQGEAMQATLEPFFEILFSANPKSIGGKLPDPAFYWVP